VMILIFVLVLIFTITPRLSDIFSSWILLHRIGVRCEILEFWQLLGFQVMCS
jgi:hypothetical protein